jgi:DNA polymerase-1
MHYVAGDRCPVYVPEFDEDIIKFEEWLATNCHEILAIDTEATGLDIYSRDHKLRLVQVGTGNEVWVLRADKFADVIRSMLLRPFNFVAHNAQYDMLVFDRHLGVKLEQLMPKVHDTKIHAHLLDPRGRDEGGIGLMLKNLSERYVDDKAKDFQTELYAAFHHFGWTKKTGWARIPIEHVVYLLYASMDVLLTARLFKFLRQQTSGMDGLCRFEHRLQYLLTMLRRKGMRIDVPYTERLATELHNDWVHYCDLALELGVDSVNSTAQVIARLQEMGETLNETTKTGDFKVDRAVLLPLADLDDRWKRIGAREPNPLADAVIRAKRALKWKETYAEAMLLQRDPADRIHPTINSLQARTARMSISDVPLQQLPSGDWRVRRSIIPDDGMVMIAADYQAVEMRVLAALSSDFTMKAAIRDGKDLHTFTAAKVAGMEMEEFKRLLDAGDPDANRRRKIAKSIGFGKVYGGGAATVSRQTGADIEGVRTAMKAYDETYPGIRRYARELARKAEGGLREVVTPIGRRLPLDEDRIYAATNYMVQSTARDLLAKAVVHCFEQGLGDYLLLPVHDELLGQAPSGQAEEVITEIGNVMESTFKGVFIESSPKVLGTSWGAGYKAPEVLPMEPLARKERKVGAGQWVQEGLDLAALC